MRCHDADTPQALVVGVGAKECLFSVDAGPCPQLAYHKARVTSCAGDAEAIKLQQIIERSGMMLTDTKKSLFNTRFVACVGFCDHKALQ